MAGLESAGLTIGNRGVYGAPGWIRTSTEPLLRRSPLPVGLRAHIGGQSRIRTADVPKGLPGLQPGAFSLSANCPNANCQRSGGRQAARTPMSQGTLA